MAAAAALACATVPPAPVQGPTQALEAALRCAPAQFKGTNDVAVLIQRCGVAGHPLEPVENLFRDVEVLEVVRKGARWVGYVRRSSSLGSVVFSYVFDDAGVLAERHCHSGVPAEGTPVAVTGGRMQFVDWCQSVAPPCRPPSTGALGTSVQFDVEGGRLVRPKRIRSASTVSDRGEAPDTCVYVTQALPVPTGAAIELGPIPEVMLWRPGKGRVDRASVVAGDLLLVPHGPRKIHVQGQALAVGGARPTAVQPVQSQAAAKAWMALLGRLKENPKARMRWHNGRFLLGLGATREVWRPLDDGTLDSTCRYIYPRALDAPASSELPTGSDCRNW